MARRSKRYDDALAAVRHVVNKHDPEGLLELGAPRDEYDPEVSDLVRLVLREAPPNEVEIIEVWNRWFGDVRNLRGSVGQGMVADLCFLHERFSGTYGADGARAASYPCPCCGWVVFEEESGSYDICPVCGWEDDLTQLRFPRMGGANIPLLEAQRAWLGESASVDLDPATLGYQREQGWRPLDPSSDDIEDPSPGRDYGSTYEQDRTRYYYWRPKRSDGADLTAPGEWAALGGAARSSRAGVSDTTLSRRTRLSRPGPRYIGDGSPSSCGPAADH